MVTVSLRKGQGRAFPAAGPACLKTELGTGGQGADFTIRAGGSLGRVLNFPKVHCHHLQLAMISDLQDTHEDLITNSPCLFWGLGKNQHLRNGSKVSRYTLCLYDVFLSVGLIMFYDPLGFVFLYSSAPVFNLHYHVACYVSLYISVRRHIFIAITIMKVGENAFQCLSRWANVRTSYRTSQASPAASPRDILHHRVQSSLQTGSFLMCGAAVDTGPP